MNRSVPTPPDFPPPIEQGSHVPSGAEPPAQPEQLATDDSLAADQDASAKRKIPAGLLSLITHLVILITLGLLLRPVVKGVEGPTYEEVGIAIAPTSSSEVEFFSEEDLSDLEATETDASDSSESSSALAEQSESPLDTSGIFPTIEGLVGPSGQQSSAVANTGQLIQGLGSGEQLGNSTSTQVFGAQGTGNKFIYVFDRSSSMSGFGGRPLAAAQSELLGSLTGLKETNQFQIIFYNDDPSVFNPLPNRPARLLFGTEENIDLAQGFIRGIRASGGTRHLEPLRQALGMAPDVIFFLTDAQEPQLTEAELRDITRRNRSAASINTIEFGAGPQRSGSNFLVELARQNNGQHVYVDVTKLTAIRPR